MEGYMQEEKSTRPGPADKSEMPFEGVGIKEL